jgi:glycosyltransferase involved in cell wall biosynthesis
VSDEVLRSLYGHADALLLPFHDVTAANALLEGMACGLPVVSNRVASVECYAGSGTGILVEGREPGGWIDALRKLRSDAAARQEMGRSARARSEELAWPRVARQYADLYERLAFS